MDSTQGVIACIGWGSLVWDPRDLPLRGQWQNDGPILPVEFVRESGAKAGMRGDKITLVIHPAAPRVQTYWALLDVPDLETARRQLASREGIPKRWEKDIGYADLTGGATMGSESETIASWGAKLALSGVVWTNLPPKFDGIIGTIPTPEDVVAFLQNLDEAKRAEAEEYVRQVPSQIDTPYRRLIEERLGWHRSS